MTPLISKYLWRKGYLRVPESCSVETDGTGDTSTCRASCPAELYESRGMTPYDVLIDVHALLWIGRFSGGVIVSCRNLRVVRTFAEAIHLGRIVFRMRVSTLSLHEPELDYFVARDFHSGRSS